MMSGQKEQDSGGFSVFIAALVIFILILAAMFIGWLVDTVAYAGLTVFFWLVYIAFYALLGIVILILSALIFDWSWSALSERRRRIIRQKSLEHFSNPSFEIFKSGQGDPFDNLLSILLRQRYVQVFGRELRPDCFGGNTDDYERFRRIHLYRMVSKTEARLKLESFFSDLHDDFTGGRLGSQFDVKLQSILDDYESEPVPYVSTRNVFRLLFFLLTFRWVRRPFSALKRQGRTVEYYKNHKGEFIRLMNAYVFELLNRYSGAFGQQNKLVGKHIQERLVEYKKAVDVLPPPPTPKSLPSPPKKEPGKPAPAPPDETPKSPEEVSKQNLMYAKKLMDGAVSQDNTKAVCEFIINMAKSNLTHYAITAHKADWNAVVTEAQDCLQKLSHFENRFSFLSSPEGMKSQGIPNWFIRARGNMTQKGEDVKKLAKRYYFEETKP